MAIQIADGFQLRVAKPLDDRQNVETVAQLDPTYGYEGQIVYVKDIKQFYTCYKDENGSLAYKVMETGSSTPNESAGIKLWVSGESYKENDFVSYNDYIYRCKIANNDTDFVEDNWQKQSDTHVEITEQEILDLLDLTDEELETMAHLIDDSAISLNKTYSSSKIYTDIRQCLQDSKDFTLEELGKKIGASYEVVASTDDMVSQDYLYLLNNGNNYDIYIVDVDNTPVVIGDTDIDLSGYVTKTEIESELGTERLGTTSQTVKGAINELLVSGGEVMDTTELTSSALGGIGAGADLDGMTAIEILTQMLYPYVKPTIIATGTPNGGTFEVGDNKTITKVSVVITKKSKKIVKLEVLDGGVSLGLLEDDTIANGGAFNFPVNVEVASVNKQLTAIVTDEQGSEVSAKTGTFTFVRPYYVGICDENATINETLIKGLTKKVETKASKTISYTTSNQKMVFAYPSSYGAISKIYDSNNFDVTNTFTRQEVSVTGLDGQAVNYYVYTNEASTVSGFSMKFQY